MTACPFRWRSRSRTPASGSAYHGAFAARGCWRVAPASAPRAEGSSAPAAAPPAAAPPAAGAESPPPPLPSAAAAAAPAGPRAPPPDDYIRPRHVAWAELLRRTFALDVLACPDCGGRLRLVATIADPRAIASILAHLGLPLEPPRPAPARQPGWLPGVAS